MKTLEFFILAVCLAVTVEPNVAHSQSDTDFLSEYGYALNEAAPAGIISDVVDVPSTAKWMLIGFEFLNAGDGDWLSVHIGDRMVFTISENDVENILEPKAALIDVSEFAGSTDTLVFLLNSVGQLNAQVVINESPVFLTSTNFQIDHLSVVRNGNSLFDDPFDDGLPPPSAPNFATGAAASYTVSGTFSNESYGKLELDINGGIDSVTPAGRPARIQSARLLTSTNPDSSRNLGPDDTFSVYATYDLVLPSRNSEAFRLNLTDRTQPQGPGDTTNDVVRLAVERSNTDRPDCRDPITHSPVGAAKGEVVIRLSSSDFVEDTGTTLDCFKVDLSGDPDQIRLGLHKWFPGSNEIYASFQYMKYGFPISNTELTVTDTIFNGGLFPDGTPFAAEAHTRPQFDTFMIPGTPTSEFGVELTTGSPVSISQTVNTFDSPFTLEFFHEFKTTTGTLNVFLGGVNLLTIHAPGVLNPNFQKASVRIDNPSLLAAADLELEFLFDGPTGSAIVLDDIFLPGLANGGFQGGNLSMWNVVTTGSGSVGASQVPSLIPVDIKPETCPNDFSIRNKGSFPVAILGTARFDVSNVDVSSIRLQGVTPVRSSVNDVASVFTPFGGKQDSTDCTNLGADGFNDMIIQFDAQQIASAVGAVKHGTVVALNLTANLLDGTPVRGEDVVVIKTK